MSSSGNASDEGGVPGSAKIHWHRYLWHLYAAYEKSDRARVGPMIMHLRARHVGVWWDQDEVRPWNRLQSKIEHGLKHSACVAYFISEHSKASKWTELETSDALLHERLVVLRLDPKGAWYPAGLAALPDFDVSGPNWRDEVDRLADQIARQGDSVVPSAPGDRPAPLAAPAPPAPAREAGPPTWRAFVFAALLVASTFLVYVVTCASPGSVQDEFRRVWIKGKLAEIYARLGTTRLDERAARLLAPEAIELEACRDRVIGHLRARRFDDAEQCLDRRLFALVPDEPADTARSRALLARLKGLILLHRGRRDDAAEWFAQARAICSDPTVDADVLALLELVSDSGGLECFQDEFPRVVGARGREPTASRGAPVRRDAGGADGADAADGAVDGRAGPHDGTPERGEARADDSSDDDRSAAEAFRAEFESIETQRRWIDSQSALAGSGAKEGR